MPAASNPALNPIQTPKCRLDPINLHDSAQVTELLSQRVLCGWDSEHDVLLKWRDEQDQGSRHMFWVMRLVPSQDSSCHDSNSGDGSSTSLNREVEVEVRAGHIALTTPSPDLIPPSTIAVTTPNPSRANTLSVNSLFIHPSHRTHSLGRTAVSLIERAACTLHPSTRYLTLTALSDRYLDDDGPEGRGIWARIGWEVPGGSVRGWYERLGYVGWKEGVVYEVDVVEGVGKGGTVGLWEVFMWKGVGVEG